MLTNKAWCKTTVITIVIALLISGCVTRQQTQDSPTGDLPTAEQNTAQSIEQIESEREIAIEKLLEEEHDLSLGTGLVYAYEKFNHVYTDPETRIETYERDCLINHFDPETATTTEIIGLKDKSYKRSFLLPASCFFTYIKPITVTDKKLYVRISTDKNTDENYEILETDLATGQKRIIQIPEIIKKYFYPIEIFPDGFMLWKQSNADKIHVFNINTGEGITYPIPNDGDIFTSDWEGNEVDTYDETTKTAEIITGYWELGVGKAERFRLNLNTGEITNHRKDSSNDCLGEDPVEGSLCTTPEQIADNEAWFDFIHKKKWDTKNYCLGYTIEEVREENFKGLKMTSENKTYDIENAHDYYYWCVE